MGRNFGAGLGRAIRAYERSVRSHERALKAEARQAEQNRRSWERQARLNFVEARQAEASERNEEIQERDLEISRLLIDSFDHEPAIDTNALYHEPDPEDLPAELKLIEKPNQQSFATPRPNIFERILPGGSKRHQEARLLDQKRYEDALGAYHAAQEKRLKLLDELSVKAREHNARIDALFSGLGSKDPDAILTYYQLVFDASTYPDYFPGQTTVAYLPESKLLAIKCFAPTIDDSIPLFDGHKYVKASNEIVGKPRTEKKRKTEYLGLLARFSLRVLREAFAADKFSAIETVAVSIFVAAIDRATGKAVEPCLISVSAMRSKFEELDLNLVDPVDCLKGLKATVSRSPSELLPVRPVIELNMNDPRYVTEQDIVSTLNTKPNLMLLNPSEFESLITNLFEKMGLETRLTRASRDGGVDCVAYDVRPVIGGKVVIQAKRYKNTVGVGAVRDLFGTLHNEGASKGILVTTSGFGDASYEFIKGKSLELVSGSELLYLLKEHANVDALIEVPDDWSEPSLS